MVPTTIAKIFALLFLAHFSLAVPLLEYDEFGGPAAVSRRDLNLPTRSFNAGISNAERLRRGLPLKKPVMRELGYRDSAPATPSPNVPIYRHMVIQVLSTEPGNPSVGYVSKTQSPSGNVVGVTSSFDSALIVRYDITLSAPYNLELENAEQGLAPYHNLGMTIGPSATSSSLGSGSYNYCFFTSTNPTPQGSTPVKQGSSLSTSADSESAVFTFDASNNLFAQWKNPDGSSPAIYVMYAPGPNFLTITGDIAAYQAAFGTSRKQVLLKLVDAPL